MGFFFSFCESGDIENKMHAETKARKMKKE